MRALNHLDQTEPDEKSPAPKHSPPRKSHCDPIYSQLEFNGAHISQRDVPALELLASAWHDLGAIVFSCGSVILAAVSDVVDFGRVD